MALMGAVALAAACGQDAGPGSEPGPEETPERTVSADARPTATSEPAAEVGGEDGQDGPAPSATYRMGLFEEPITRNFWAYFGGPGGSVWSKYVLQGHATSLYGYSDQRFDWVPVAAAGLPTDLVRETVDGVEYWTTQVSMREGIEWSDGEELNAEDVLFTVNTVLEMGLGADWASAVDSNFVDRVEALDSHLLKIFFKTTDAEGNPLTPGLAVWQFGLAMAPILAEHYWAPVVEAAKGAGDGAQQIEALFAHVPDGEPTANGYTFTRWEPGAFFENRAADNFFRSGAVVTQYAGGAYVEANERLGYMTTLYGDASGDKILEFEVGPHADRTLFSIYGNQDTAVLALANGDVDYLFNPLGMEKGFQDRIRATEDLVTVTNLDNGIFYLGFNARKPPMSILEFRQAVATVIDKEFVASTILQDAAIPMYSTVPEGNTLWFNPDVRKFGQGASRAERVARAVELLKSAGFTYGEEPEVDAENNFVSRQGKGLRGPDGAEVPTLEIIAPSPGYDPLRSTFAIWIERWLNDVGIPARANLTGFNVIVDRLFSDTVARDLDMWILGWSLRVFPDYIESFFHTRHAPENEEGGSNWGGYSNPTLDEMATQLLSETTIEGARERAMRIQEFLSEDLPYVPLFTVPKLDAYRPSRVEFPYTTVLGGLVSQSGLQQIALIK